MSSVEEFKFQVIPAIERKIDDLIASILDYARQNAELMQEICDAVAGAAQPAEREMMTQIQETRNRLKEAAERLRSAKEEIERYVNPI